MPILLVFRLKLAHEGHVYHHEKHFSSNLWHKIEQHLMVNVLQRGSWVPGPPSLKQV